MMKGSELMENTRIAVVGGTGPQGRGLAYRFALAGHSVIVGSRERDRAREKAEEIAERGPGLDLTGEENLAAAEAAQVVVLAVPYEGHADLVASLAPALDGKVVISCVNPLGFDTAGPYALQVEDGSAAEEAARVAPGARIVGAFHHVSAVNLWRHEGPLADEDVLVCGDDDEANDMVADLARTVTGRPGVVAGGLRLARELEPWTGVLISINKRHKVRSGTRISGLPGQD